MRAAVLALNHDQAFADDALKTIGFVPEYSSGPETNRQVRQAIVLKPETRAFAAEYLKRGTK